MTDKYYKTKESVDEYIELAKDVSGKELIDKLRKYITSDSKILEVGSGPGTDWNIFNKQYNVTGSDFSNEFIVRLKENNPDGEFLKLDAVTLTTNLKFECIYSNKVLHHLNDVELAASVNRQHELLNDNGIICHSFWKGEGTEEFKGMFVNYHKTEDLKQFFTPLFELLTLELYNEFEDNDSIFLIARKK